MPDYAPGTPMWIDVSSSNMDTSKAFYGELFGWKAEESADPQAGGYTLFTKDGKMVAGLGPTFSPEQPVAWSTYVATIDAAAAAGAVTENGGRVITGPMVVLDQGTMAVFTDPTGAFISVWQPNQHRGAELVNAVGSFVWSELYTRDIPTAKAFYEKVFGWEAEDSPLGNGGMYTTFKVGGRGIAGGMDMSFLPDDIPPHWLTYFTVSSADDAVAKVRELGGQVLSEPMDIDIGRFATVQDPLGAVFAVYEVKQQQ